MQWEDVHGFSELIAKASANSSKIAATLLVVVSNTAGKCFVTTITSSGV